MQGPFIVLKDFLTCIYMYICTHMRKSFRTIKDPCVTIYNVYKCVYIRLLVCIHVGMYMVLTGVWIHLLITSACICELKTILKRAYAFKCMAGSQEQVPCRSPKMTSWYTWPVPYLHSDDALFVNTIEPGAQGHLCLIELFLRALIEEVLLVMCLNVRVLQGFCNFVMCFLVGKSELDFYLQAQDSWNACSLHKILAWAQQFANYAGQKESVTPHYCLGYLCLLVMPALDETRPSALSVPWLGQDSFCAVHERERKDELGSKHKTLSCHCKKEEKHHWPRPPEYLQVHVLHTSMLSSVAYASGNWLLGALQVRTRYKRIYKWVRNDRSSK